MLQVDPPDHNRYRHPVAHAFTPRAVDKLRTRIIEVTNDLIDSLEASRHSDLITDYAAPLPAEIIAEILAIPAERRSGLLGRGENGAPLLDIGVSWATFRRGMQALRDSGREIGERTDQLRTDPGDDIFSHIIHDVRLDPALPQPAHAQRAQALGSLPRAAHAVQPVRGRGRAHGRHDPRGTRRARRSAGHWPGDMAADELETVGPHCLRATKQALHDAAGVRMTRHLMQLALVLG